MWLAFGLTLVAGLATGLGGVISTLIRAGSHRLLCASLGFSAGVMIYVSMMELAPAAAALLSDAIGARPAGWVAAAAFFGGILVAALIDWAVPSEFNPHEPSLDAHLNGRQRTLARTGLITAIAVALHNFPEGFATFMAALEDPQLGIPVAIAVAIHNVPEGMAVAVPIHQATGSRRKGMIAAWLSGLAEPVGAVVGYLLLRPWLNDVTLGVVLALVAGIMVFISFDELLPTAEEYGEHHLATYGLIAGMAVMALSLLLLAG